MKAPFYSLSLQCLFDSYYYYFLSKIVCFRDFVIVVIIFVSKMGSLFSLILIIRVSQNSVAYYYWVCSEYLGYYKMRAKAKRSIILFNLTSSCSHNSFMTIKQVLFLIFSKKVKIYYSITAKNFHFIMAY